MSVIEISLIVILVIGAYLGFHHFYISHPQAERVTRRIEKIAQNHHGKFTDLIPEKVLSFKESQLEKRLNSYLKQDGFGYGYVRLKLMRSGLKYTLDKLVGCFFLLWFFVFIVIYWVFKESFNHSFLYGLLGAAIIAHYYVGREESKRKNLIISQLAPALEIILRGVRAGSQIDKTFQIVAREIHSPLKEEFMQMNSEIDFGADFDKVLHASAIRVDIPDYYFFITTLVIQRRTGGSLADVLENIITTLSKSQELRMKIKVFSSEAKASGYVLAALPGVIMAVLWKIKPDQVEFFFKDPLGHKLLVIAISMIIMALVMIKRMIKLDV